MADQGEGEQTKGFETQSQELKTQIQELKTQSQELLIQSQELKTQSQELKTQSQELRTQSQELKTQILKLKTESQELETQNQELKTQSQATESGVECVSEVSKESETQKTNKNDDNDVEMAEKNDSIEKPSESDTNVRKDERTDKDGDIEMTETNEKSEDPPGNKKEVNSTTSVNGNGNNKSTINPSGNDGYSHNYELVNGQYYYSDTTSGKRYKYDDKAQDWVEVSASGNDSEQIGNDNVVAKNAESDASSEKHETEHSVTTDSEGRTYYYADNHYLCQDKDGNVFYLTESNEWKPWGENDSATNSETSKWYFCQGNSTFYRDNASGVVYRLNKDSNEWEKYEGKLKKKRPLIDEEEFDTEEEDSDEDCSGGLMPPGAKEDPNISYDGTTYTKVDPVDNMKYEWDTERRAWFPKLDEDFMATYQLSYGFNPDGTKNENPLKFDDDVEEEEEARAAEELKKKQEKEAAKASKKQSWFEMDETRNTKVYVSNLPDNTTENTFITLMQKCGMVMLDEKTSKPKIKLYRDDEGNFKGDALCTYIKVESVELAEQILDGYEVGRKKIRVEPAKFEQKGAYNPKLKPRKKGKKELERIKKKQEKLFDWRPEPMRGERKKNENTVVIRNVFDPKEFEVAMDKILDHKEAMRSQASNFGKIKKLELYDLHPEGVVQVTFEEVESADMCVATLHKRLYSGRTLYVTTWDGREKFKIEETAAEREKRIKKWNEFLESEATGSK